MAIDDSRKSAQFTLYSSWNVQRISAKSIEEREPKEIDDDSKMMQSTSIENCISTRQKTTDRKVFVLFLFLLKRSYVLEFNRTGERLCNLFSDILMQILSGQVPQ